MVRLAEIGWISAQNAPEGLRVGSTLIAGGQSRGEFAASNLAAHVGDDPLNVQANRQTLLDQIGAKRLQWLQQVHGETLVYADDKGQPALPSADAVWTDQRQLGLAILTADCVPVLLWRADTSIIVGIHAGWRGLRAQIIEQTVAALPVANSRWVAWIGPCISAAHYEVGQAVWSKFEGWPEQQILRPHPTDAQKRNLNLAAAAFVALKRAGVDEICCSGICNYSDPRFYSFRGRRAEETGRFASVIMRI